MEVRKSQPYSCYYISVCYDIYSNNSKQKLPLACASMKHIFEIGNEIASVELSTLHHSDVKIYICKKLQTRIIIKKMCDKINF